jgi:hypothetical protein
MQISEPLSDLGPVVVFFVALVALVRAFLEHFTRRRLIERDAPESLVRVMLPPRSAPRPASELLLAVKWGILLLSGGSGMLVAHALGAASLQAFTGIVLLALGVGMLAYGAAIVRLSARYLQEPGLGTPEPGPREPGARRGGEHLE